MKKSFLKIANIISIAVVTGVAATILPLAITNCGSKPRPTPPEPVPPSNDLALNATTDSSNKSNHGTLINKEISFNTWDNKELHVTVKKVKSNADLEWQWSKNNWDWSNLDTLATLTNLEYNDLTLGKLDLISGDPGASQYIQFYIRATIIGSDLIPDSIRINFHNAPEVGSDQIINTTDNEIIGFDQTSLLSQYDTIYIPNNITKIDDDVFYDKFTGSGNCEDILNVIFADRLNDCDVGKNAFSSSTTLSVKGEVYIGEGRYVAEATDSVLFFSIDNSADSATVLMGDITIEGDVYITGHGDENSICFFTSRCNEQPHLTIGDININGNCTLDHGNDNIPYVLFFSSRATISPFAEGDLNIKNINFKEGTTTTFICNNRGHFFDKYTSGSIESFHAAGAFFKKKPGQEQPYHTDADGVAWPLWTDIA